MKKLILLLAVLLVVLPLVSADQTLLYNSTYYSTGSATFVKVVEWDFYNNTKISSVLNEVNSGGTIMELVMNLTHEDGTQTRLFSGTINTGGVWQNRSMTNPNYDKFVETVELFIRSSGAGGGVETKEHYIYGNITDIFVSLLEPSDGSGSISSGIIFNVSGRPTVNYTMSNATLYIWNSTGDIVNQSFNLISGNPTNYTFWNVTNINTNGAYTWNTEICGFNASTTSCDFADTNYTFTSGVVVEDINYTSIVFDTDYQRLSLNISFDAFSINFASATLNYDGVAYASNSTGTGGERYFTVDLGIPVISAAENKTFNWTIFLSDTSEQFSYTTENYNQSVLPSTFISCGAGNPIVNYSIRDEQTNVLLTSDFAATFFWRLNESSTVRKNISLNLSGSNNYDFCSNNNNKYFMDNEILIELDGYKDRKFSLNLEEYTTTTTERVLYLINESDARTVILELKDEGLSPLEGYIVRIYRNSPATEGKILVEEDVTNVFGQVVAQLIEETVDYDFEIYNQVGSLVKSVRNTNVACKATICIIPLVVADTTDPFGRFSDIEDFSCGLSFNNNTNTYSFSWTDITGESSTQRLLVELIAFNGTSSVCDTTSTLATGNLNCAVGNARASYSAQVFRQVTGEAEIRIRCSGALYGSLDVKVGDLSGTFGLEGFIWAFILLFSLIMIAIYSPVVSILLYMVGIIFLSVTQIVTMSPALVIAQLVIGGFLIWALRQ